MEGNRLGQPNDRVLTLRRSQNSRYQVRVRAICAHFAKVKYPIPRAAGSIVSHILRLRSLVAISCAKRSSKSLYLYNFTGSCISSCDLTTEQNVGPNNLRPSEVVRRDSDPLFGSNPDEHSEFANLARSRDLARPLRRPTRRQTWSWYF